jgi:nucleoid-associated protein YgaU
MLINPIVFVDPDGEDPFSIFLGVITFLFGDIPSAGENDDGEFSSSQSNEDWIYDNTDDMIVDRFVQNLPWHIKAPIKVGEFVVDQYGNINNDGESSDGNMTWDDSASEYTYVVESGDTMYDLFGDNYSDVAEYNGIEDPGKIQPGQEIRIPVE